MTFGLEGVRIIQTAAMAAGPMAGRLLADWGADVICIEHIARPGMMGRRHISQFASRRVIASDINYNAQNTSRNKRSITLDLSKDDGRKIIYKLLENSDVLLTNFRMRELEKFKLEYETLSQLNPRLICAHLTGYGMKGPEMNTPGYGPMASDARSGLLHLLKATGAEPVQFPLAYADYITGMSLAMGIMTALYVREKTGEGQEVNASLFNTGVWAVSSDLAATLVTGQDRQALSRRDTGSPLMNIYETKDGRWLYLSVGEGTWSNFCHALGQDLEHDQRFATPESRVENHFELYDAMREAFLSKTLDEWRPRLNEAALPWAPLQKLPEVINDPQARANDFFIPLDHPVHGRIEVVANPIKLSKTKEIIRMPAPEPGQHTDEVLSEFGYSETEIAQFREQEVIQ
jgi:crotonobetainyl-CoA:carnitine CoA-transferase CaiB-like acyl-CoA transferase